MRNTKIVFIIILLFLCNACATKALWENTDPNEYVKIKYSEITEDKLIEKGAKYYRDDKAQAFYVEKDSFSKFKDYSYRALATPLTITLDTTAVVVFTVAYIACQVEAKSAVSDFCEDNPLCGNKK